MAPNIFCAHWRLGSVLATFGSSLPKFLAQFMDFSGGMSPVGIVISNQEHILPLRENKIRNVHDGKSEQVSVFVGEEVEVEEEKMKKKEKKWKKTSRSRSRSRRRYCTVCTILSKVSK